MPENCAAIVIAAKHHELIKVKDVRGTTNTIGALRCKFQFRTDDWLHSAKTAMFCNGDAVLHPEVINDAISVPLDVDAECPVPYEVLTDTLPYSIGVWGVTDKGFRIVSNWLVFNAQVGCYTEGNAPQDPERTVYEEILLISKDAVDAASVVTDRANSGEFDGEDGITPHIGANGNWFIGNTDTNVAATGVDGYTPIKGVDYFDGVDGRDGYTPVKGVDYFDGESGKDGYTPVKGKDYFDGADGKNGIDGKDGYTPIKGKDYFDGKDGKDGYTPVKGVDYVDGKDGITPQLKIDSENYWCVSYDNGASWASLGVKAGTTFDSVLSSSDIVHGNDQVLLSNIINEYILNVDYSALAFDTTELVVNSELSKSSVLGQAILGQLVLA